METAKKSSSKCAGAYAQLHASATEGIHLKKVEHINVQSRKCTVSLKQCSTSCSIS